jgi:hypothetical protein
VIKANDPRQQNRGARLAASTTSSYANASSRRLCAVAEASVRPWKNDFAMLLRGS